MTFIEEFPSLKHHRMHPCKDEGHQYRGPHCALCPDGDFLEVKIVQECCLDKQKVRNAIEKCSIGNPPQEVNLFIQFLKKELNL